VNTKEIKAYLMQYRDSMKRAHAIADHLSELRDICEKLSANDINRRELDRAIKELADATDKAGGEIKRLVSLENEIERVIGKSEEPFRTILYERYINGKTWEQIAVQMHYCFRHTTKLHGMALEALKDVLECPTRNVL
jgi:hypothetical protein